MKTNATIQELNQALIEVNKMYSNNIRFKDIKTMGRRSNFTLTVRDSKEPGHRRGFNGQRLAAACWHVHGHFFEALLNINPDIYIISGGSLRIDINGGNWQDRNIGSNFQHLYFSEACDCN